MREFKDYIFLYGKAQKYEDVNMYIFENEQKDRLIVSEKNGKFINGSVSQYLLFQFMEDKKEIKKYVDRKSDYFHELSNIRAVVDNLDGNVVQCTNCNTIVLKDKITSSRGDSCYYCDKYACKKCKKILPLIELDDNRLCEKCRGKK